MYKYKITVFTPTYNRGYIIKNLFTSLKEQTVNEFEWLVIDDGSTDNTNELFEVWKKEKHDFPIRYIKVENGGKHRAINKAVDLAEGELFFIVDSDDCLTKDAIETIINWEKTIHDFKEKYAGVSGNKGSNSQEIIGTTFQGEFVDATSLERTRNGINGDKAEVFYTDILKKFRFPEFENENFITENVVWNKIAFKGYKIRWFNKIIYICDYLEDGLTKEGVRIFIKNPKGYGLAIKQNILFNNPPFIKRIHLWFDYYIHLRNNLSIQEMSKNLGICPIILSSIVFTWKVKNKLKRSLHENQKFN